MRRRIILPAAAAMLAALPMSAQAAARPVQVRTSQALISVAADGGQVAFETTQPPSPSVCQGYQAGFYRWTPGLRPRLMSLDAPPCAVTPLWSLTIANGRMRWLQSSSGNYTYYATRAPGAAHTAVYGNDPNAFIIDNSTNAGDALMQMVGSGHLIALAEQHYFDKDGAGCQLYQEGTGGTADDCAIVDKSTTLHNGIPLNGIGVQPVLPTAWTGPYNPVSVDAGRVLLVGLDGSARLRLTGGTVRSLVAPGKGAVAGAISGRRAVIRRGSSIDVVSITGARKRTCSAMAASRPHIDLASGIAVYNGVHRVWLLRASDCATRLLATIQGRLVRSAITERGVTYGFNTRFGHGVVVHWPWAQVAARFG